MKCYNHPETDAVGTCKSCSKGLCHNCLTDTGNGIACTATCVEEVKTLNKLTESNKSRHKSLAKYLLNMALLVSAIGAFILFISLYIEDESGVNFSILIGWAFVLAGAVNFYSSFKYNKK